jgi:hypothetical protein
VLCVVGFNGSWYEGMWKTLEKMTRSEADSGVRTVESLSTCVAPIEVMYGQVPGMEWLKSSVEPLL